MLIVAPFIINTNGEYEGADAQAEVIINEINSEYEPWANSLWEPPSGEVESLFLRLKGIRCRFYWIFYRKQA